MIRSIRPLALLALATAAFTGTPAQAVEIGKPAPDFTATDETGAKHALSQYRGKLVVLEWTNPECPYVARHYSRDTMEKLAQGYGARGVVWLAVNSTHGNLPADTLKWKQEQGFQYATLQDSSGELGKLYGARTTPHMFIIDGQGALRYDGAIDDDPRGRKQDARNFVDTGLGALLAGKSPEPTTSQPYGCSVKYR
jgi:peroxiredoxin